MIYQKVKEQQAHFGLLYSGKPRHLEIEEKLFYYGAIDEELQEYYNADELVDEYDALLDLLVFTTGALLRHGFPQEGINEVVRANLEKRVGPLEKRGGFQLDLFKPEGWRAPDLKSYLE